MWTLQDAKNRFSSVVEAALAGTPQEVSRRGRPAVVVVAAADYARLVAEARRHRGSFVAHLLACPASSDEASSDGAGEGEVPRAAVRPRDVVL